ncbi:hypothetical protein C9I56_34965 [Paraburkholderia caribensis]|nr:hypothetical protein C9I56_34965 [Paraburkholderia caribensis]
MLVVLLAFGGSIFAGRSGSLGFKHLALIEIEPANKVRPAACESLLTDIAELKLATIEERQRLALLEAALLDFRRKYANEPYIRFWGLPGDDNSKWGVGLWEANRQETKIKEQREIVDESLGKLTATLDTLQKKCELPQASSEHKTAD